VLRGAGNVVATFSGHTHRVQTLDLKPARTADHLNAFMIPPAAAYLCMRGRCEACLAPPWSRCERITQRVGQGEGGSARLTRGVGRRRTAMRRMRRASTTACCRAWWRRGPAWTGALAWPPRVP
jgi:hypothetical protein